MDPNDRLPSSSRSEACSCCKPSHGPTAFSRRGFLGGLGGTAVLSSLPVLGGGAVISAAELRATRGQPLPVGKPLRVQPLLMVHLDRPAEKTSWRSYGGIQTPADIEAEQGRIEQQLGQLAADAEFPVQFLPLQTIRSPAEMQRVADSPADMTVLFAASGGTDWVQPLLETSRPLVLFLRHRSGPFYLWYEIAHWRFLRQNEDDMTVPNVDAGDVVVDDNAELLWRMRSVYGLINARGTTMLAIGGLAAYSEPAQCRGPPARRTCGVTGLWRRRRRSLRDA